MFALFDNLGTFELMICGVVALLVFGKRLPEVASQAGATLSRFRKGLDNAIQDSGVEREIKKIKDALPTDMSMTDVARAAKRRVEGRMRELSDEAQKIEDEVARSLQASAEPTSPTDLASPTTPGSPEAPAVPGARDGVDPAKHFRQPGSVPRE